jgi:hypothetical protein
MRRPTCFNLQKVSGGKCTDGSEFTQPDTHFGFRVSERVHGESNKSCGDIQDADESSGEDSTTRLVQLGWPSVTSIRSHNRVDVTMTK